MKMGRHRNSSFLAKRRHKTSAKVVDHILGITRFINLSIVAFSCARNDYIVEKTMKHHIDVF